MKNLFKTRASRRRCCQLALLCAVAFPVAALPLPSAHAQTALAVSSPTDGQTVRGTFKSSFSGVPAGGYAMVYVDLTPGNRLEAFRGAVTSGKLDIETFGLTDGRHTLTIIAYNSSGNRVGETTVPFDVANSQVDLSAQSVVLRNWTKEDLLDPDVERYRVFAEATAKVTGGSSGGGGAMGGGMSGMGTPGMMGGAMPGMGGGGMPGATGGAGGGNPAALDKQVTLLIRRVTRDVGMVEGAANIKMSVKDAFERGREGASQGAGGMGGAMGMPGMMGTGAATNTAPANPDEWAKDWSPAQENGEFYVKMIKANGEEINATRKKPSIALGDLLPRFPTTAVRPGSSWESEITLVAELVERKPVTVRAPMYFTSFEMLKTPAGVPRRCAKLESRFPLSKETAEKIAKRIASASGSAGGMGAMGGGMMGAGGAMPGMGMPGMLGGSAGGAMGGGAEASVKNARTNVTRTMWFDIKARRLLRSEDVVETYYEGEAQAAMGGGAMSGMMGGGMPGMMPGMPGMGMPGGAMGGAKAEPAEPTKTTYTLRVARYLDDTVPAPTENYNAGAGTAHARDNVQDPSLAPVLNRR